MNSQKLYSKIFSKANLILGFGITSYIGLYLSTKKIKNSLNNTIIDEAIDIMKISNEVIETVGSEIKIKDNLFSLLKTKIDLKDKLGEAKFFISGPKGDFEVLINTSSQKLSDLKMSKDPSKNFKKYYIPEYYINEINLNEKILPEDFTFKSLDYFTISKKGQSQIILKTSNDAQISKRLNYQNLLDELKERKNLRSNLITKEIYDKNLITYRMKQSFQSRNTMMGSIFYFGLLGIVYYQMIKKNNYISRLSGSVIFNHCLTLLKKNNISPEKIIINNTCNGLLNNNNFNLEFMYSSPYACGRAIFKGRIDGSNIDVKKAITIIKNLNIYEEISLMN